MGGLGLHRAEFLLILGLAKFALSRVFFSGFTLLWFWYCFLLVQVWLEVLKFCGFECLC